MIIDNMGEYVLYRWPECQQFMDLEGFEEHSSLADCDLFGPSAYFIEKEWIESLDEEMEEYYQYTLKKVKLK